MTFSEDVRADTIRLALVDERTGSVVEGELSYDGRARRTVFRPGSDLLPLTSYAVTLSGGVADAAGNTLPADRKWRFTTAGLIPGLG